MIKIGNSRKASHTVFTKAGPVKIRPGEIAEVDITAAEAKEVEAAGLLVIRKGPPRESTPDSSE